MVVVTTVTTTAPAATRHLEDNMAKTSNNTALEQAIPATLQNPVTRPQGINSHPTLQIGTVGTSLHPEIKDLGFLQIKIKDQDIPPIAGMSTLHVLTSLTTLLHEVKTHSSATRLAEMEFVRSTNLLQTITVQTTILRTTILRTAILQTTILQTITLPATTHRLATILLPTTLLPITDRPATLLQAITAPPTITSM